MSWQAEVDEIERRKRFALQMGGEEAVSRQHEQGRYTVRERIELLADPGSWFEIGMLTGKAVYDENFELGILGIVPEQRCQTLPHIERDGVSLGRIVEDDVAHAVLAFGEKPLFDGQLFSRSVHANGPSFFA